MKYILIDDFKSPQEIDDAIYSVECQHTPGTETEDDVMVEIFTEGDIFKILDQHPSEADAILMKDDWVFWNSKSQTEYEKVFIIRDEDNA